MHDDCLEWAEACLSGGTHETSDRFLESKDPIVREGFVLRNALISEFKDKYRAENSLRILFFRPTAQESVGGFSLVNNLLQSLDFVGAEVEALSSDSDFAQVLNRFKPTILMVGDYAPYLAMIDWGIFDKYRRQNTCKLGLSASLEEYGNSPLPARLAWAKAHGVDFYFSFRSREYLLSRKEYQPFYDNKFKMISCEFGANPLLYYPVPGIERDLPYVFLASSNEDKRARYYQYLKQIVSDYPGIIDGPGWSNVKSWAAPQIHRFLYARAMVGINLHISDSIDWPSELNERTYILAACGVPQLVDKAMLLPDRFSDKCFFVKESPKEYLDCFRMMLKDRDTTTDKAMNALKEVYSRHTTFHRAESLVHDLQLLFQ